MTERRQFLKALAAGAASAPVLGGLLGIREALAADVTRMSLANHRAGTLSQMAREYMLSPDVTYLNHASIGTMPRVIVEARARYLELCETNPWLYMWGGAWEEAREDVRRKAASLLSATPEEITFTHNTTEAFNLLAQGLPLGPGDDVVFSSLNHTGASEAFVRMAPRRGFSVRSFNFPVTRAAELSRDDLLAQYDANITSRTRLLVFPHIDNIVGFRYPVRELTRLARSRGVEFVAVDGAQSAGMIPVDCHDFGVDVYSTSPHKWLQAPKGLGLAFVSDGVRDRLDPMWVTWGQARWEGTSRIYEDYGTRNLAEVLSLGDAIDFQARIDPVQRDRRLRDLWDLSRSLTERTPGAIWRSPRTWDFSTSVYAVEIEGKQATELSQKMYAENGFVFRPFNSQGLNTIRLSPNVHTSDESLERFFEVIVR